MMRGWQCKPCRNLQEKVAQARNVSWACQTRLWSPRLVIDIYVPLPFTFGTNGSASDAPIQQFFDDCLEQWKHRTEHAFGFVWMNHYCKFVPEKKKKSSLQSLEACRFLMVIIWDWKAMWEIGPYWFFFTGGILKAHPVLKLCFCTCCRKD